MRITVLRVLKKSGKKNLFIIPFLFTFANALWGFLAIITALEGRCIQAAACIILAALMDIVDGRLARALGSSSTLGMELDSLCDAISFCLAPTIVLYSWKFHALGLSGVIVLVAYLFAGLLRLARFNTNNAKQHTFFRGLPTPFAALCIVSLIVHEQALMNSSMHCIVSGIGLMMLVIVLAALMLSPLRFFSGKKMYMSSTYVVWAAMSILLIALWSLAHDYPTTCLLLAIYFCSNACWNVYRALRSFIRSWIHESQT